MTELRNLLKSTHEILVETLRDQEGLRVDSVDIEKVVNRAFSDVVFLRVTTSGGTRKLVLKKTIHHPANKNITERQNQAVVEFEILSQLYPKFKSVPRCNVPRPILVIPEQEAYVMDFVEGRLLGDLFASAKYLATRKAFDELKEYYYLSGVWLKKLQEFTGIRRADMAAFSNTLERCELRLKLIDEANDQRCSPDITNRIRTFISEQLALVNYEDILITGRHGDFGSWNIMAGPEGITVFDFLGYQEDLLPIDLYKMLMNFEIEKTYLFFSKKRIEVLKKSFLHGYGEIPNIACPILNICETLHRVCNIYAIVIAKNGNILRLAENVKALNANLSWFECDKKNHLS
jgi:hypothetical protein